MGRLGTPTIYRDSQIKLHLTAVILTEYHAGRYVIELKFPVLLEQFEIYAVVGRRPWKKMAGLNIIYSMDRIRLMTGGQVRQTGPSDSAWHDWKIV